MLVRYRRIHASRNSAFGIWSEVISRTDPRVYIAYRSTNILLRSDIPSGICAKLRTVAASNNRVHMPWSLYYYLFAQHICIVLFFTHIPFVVNHTINAKPPERLQQYHVPAVCGSTSFQTTGAWCVLIEFANSANNVKNPFLRFT